MGQEEQARVGEDTSRGGRTRTDKGRNDTTSVRVHVSARFSLSLSVSLSLSKKHRQRTIEAREQPVIQHKRDLH